MIRLRARLAACALPYARLELPGWGKILHITGATGRPELWRDAPSRIIRGKSHGYLMRLDLADPWDRRTYFLGRFVELETELFIKHAVREGDTVIDVGANRGMLTLTAARLVGESGQVHAVEPNPSELVRIAELLDINNITNVRLHQVALGESASSMALHILDDRPDLGTLAKLDRDAGQRVTDVIQVSVQRGDDLFAQHVNGPTLLKIDVEGFECRVLRGMRGLLDRVKPAVFAEVEPAWLCRAGASEAELFGILTDEGYLGYVAWTRRVWWKHRLSLTPVRNVDELQALRARRDGTFRNMVWLHPDSVFVARLSRWIASRAS